MELAQKYEKYVAAKRHLVEVLGICLSLFIIFTIIRGQYSVPVCSEGKHTYARCRHDIPFPKEFP